MQAGCNGRMFFFGLVVLGMGLMWKSASVPLTGSL